MSRAVAELLDILALEKLEVNLFRGRSPQDSWQRVFGGQVIGQALVAGCRIVEEAKPTKQPRADAPRLGRFAAPAMTTGGTG